MEEEEIYSQNNENSEIFKEFAIHECNQVLFEILNEISIKDGSEQGVVDSKGEEVEENKENKEVQSLEETESRGVVEETETVENNVEEKNHSDDGISVKREDNEKFKDEYKSRFVIGKYSEEVEKICSDIGMRTFCIQNIEDHDIENNGDIVDITIPYYTGFNVRIIEERINTVRIDWDLVADAEVYKIEKFHRRRGWEHVAWTGYGPTIIENLDENFSYRMRIKAKRFCETHGLFEDYKISTDFLVTTLSSLPTTLSLHRAIKKGQQFLVKRIVRRRPILLEYPGPNGYLPLANAIICNQHSVIDVLLSHGANIHIGNTNNARTPLQLAFYYGRLATARILLNRKALIEATDINDMTACHFAVDANQFELLRFGLENGANVNARDACGWSLLSRAVVMRADVGILKLLLTNGANVKLKDKLHKTCVDLAQIYKNTIAEDFFAKALNRNEEVNGECQ
ncbi:fibronectin type 3 and ankyrin repeat domains protein 1 [Eurosta solidaginis]|uniref:fibronectin type 3 and ankyrin repeat domains protein 1 n=1 Tax=Eurosta solidaginis TaxID=178769 RepID=UPI0035309CFE